MPVYDDNKDGEIASFATIYLSSFKLCGADFQKSMALDEIGVII
jgi:hypothetical protein